MVATGKRSNTNPWNKFLESHEGTLEELRKLYLSEKPEAPAVYLYDADADINHNSILHEVLNDRKLFPNGIRATNIKLSDYEELTQRESEAWLLAFELAFTDDYGLTKEQLLGSHNWWLKRLQTEAGMEDDEFSAIIDRLTVTDHVDIDEFIGDVMSSFDIYQLYSIKFPELS